MSRHLSLALLLALAGPGRAQSAADLYHAAARLYVGGERGGAEQAAERGLRLAPGDPKLRALLDRIRQDEQPRGQGGQPNQQDRPPNPDPQGDQQNGQGNEEEQEERQQNGGTNRPEDERGGAASDDAGEEQPEAEQADQSQAPDRENAPPRPDALRPGEGEATPESTAPVPPGEMTRAEAERILNAVGADERLLLRRVHRQPGRRRPVEKDW